MQTVIRQTRSPFKAGNAIGMNTQNVTFNCSDRAFELLEAVSKPNRSHFLRLCVAREMDRINRWTGMAWRKACQLGDDFAADCKTILSIFKPDAPFEEKQAAFEASLKEQRDEKQIATPNGDNVIDEAISEFDGREPFQSHVKEGK